MTGGFGGTRVGRFSFAVEIDTDIVDEQIDKLVSHRHDDKGSPSGFFLVLDMSGEVVRAM